MTDHHHPWWQPLVMIAVLIIAAPFLFVKERVLKL